MAIIERHLSTQSPTTQAPRPPLGPSGRLTRGWTIGLAVAWVAMLVASYVLEPAAARTTISALDVLVSNVLLAALGVTAGGLLTRKVWAGRASLATSVLFLGTVFACPATGHHEFGLWWFGEFAATLAVVALSGAAVWRHRRAS
jgi:hypothetical protein